MHQALCDAIAPEAPGDRSFEELSDILQNCLEPIPSVLANQNRFISKVQDTEEGISTYARELKRLAIDCDFKCYNCERSVCDMFLKMQFIRGLRDNEVRVRLLQEKGNTQSFKEVVEMAISIEQSKLESYAIKPKYSHYVTDQTKDVNYVSKQSGLTSKSRNETKPHITFQDLRGKCYRCGSTQHKADTCKFKNEFCRKCNKIGHIANVCLTRNRVSNASESAYKLKSNKIDVEDDNDNVHEVYMMGTPNVNDKFIINVSIEGKSLNMELDTGAALSSLSYSDFLKLELNKRLFKTEVEMRTYTGEIIRPVGVCFVECKYRNFSFHGKLYVLKQNVDPIFGREWLREVKMDWADIKLTDTNTSEELDKLLTNFQDIFKAEIGEINSEQGHIQLKEGAKPIFVKPRQVPYALRKAVEDELHRLESGGIISKVENSQWGTPIIPVKKPNGSVRLCADYKVTANKLILDEKYPIPRIEDIFTHMNKGNAIRRQDNLHTCLCLEET
ncbi:uncharacterized protein K02A2.6-like [Macrosteles quadrilineatus]|uniref:uncharacterized protein K02A2.6-like n=1 Tax=Macrosteles quadrilineatus TaxID=74068 RepID=UPI0023E1D25E|nr:uncharacterized protein K02A2.6-like [Macrosteles quadrilineatus]